MEASGLCNQRKLNLDRYCTYHTWWWLRSYCFINHYRFVWLFQTLNSCLVLWFNTFILSYIFFLKSFYGLIPFFSYNYLYQAYGGDWPHDLSLLSLCDLWVIPGSSTISDLSIIYLISINSYIPLSFPYLHPLSVQLELYTLSLWWPHVSLTPLIPAFMFSLYFSTISFYASYYCRLVVYPCKHYFST